MVPPVAGVVGAEDPEETEGVFSEFWDKAGVGLVTAFALLSGRTIASI